MANRLIVEEFKKRQPQAKVLFLGIFPRAAEAIHPYRAAIKDIPMVATAAPSQIEK